MIQERDPYCRGVVLLGLDAPQAELQAGFNAAAGKSIVKGFAVGRTLFGKPSLEWMKGEINDDELVQKIKTNYLNLIALWRQRK